jgi:hypothetical protein
LWLRGRAAPSRRDRAPTARIRPRRAFEGGQAAAPNFSKLAIPASERSSPRSTRITRSCV